MEKNNNKPMIKPMEVNQNIIEDAKNLAKKIKEFIVKYKIAFFYIDNGENAEIIAEEKQILSDWRLPKLQIQIKDTNFTFKHSTDIDPTYNERIEGGVKESDD